MTELISFIIFIFSLIMIGVIIFRKIPVLVQLPATASPQIQVEEVSDLDSKKGSVIFRNLSLNIFLQKIVSKIRILILKIDTKTFNLLQKLREKSQKNKFNENENYWQEIRKSTKNK